MPSKYWFKLYHEILDDPKMGQISDRLYRRCIELFALAGDYDQDGLLPEIEDIAWRLRLPVDELQKDIADLQALNIITSNDDGLVVTNFSKRQTTSSSTERTRRQRTQDRLEGTKREYWQKAIWDQLPDQPGVYKIHFSPTDKSYIGASKSIKKRIRGHLSEINGGIHSMSRDIKEFGRDGISVEVLESTESLDELPDLENRWINKYPSSDLYNNDNSPGKRHRSWDGNGTSRPIDIDIDIDIDKEVEKDNIINRGSQKSNPSNSNIWSLLLSYGIDRNPRVEQIVNKPYMTPEYLKSHVKALNRKGYEMPGSAGMLVLNLETGIDPGHEDGCQCDECLQGYTNGEYSKYIEH